MSEQQTEDAVDAYQKTRNASQEYLNSAKNAMDDGRFDEAILVLTDALSACRARSIQAEALFQRGVCHLQLEETEKALSDIKRVQKLDGGQEASSHILLALCHSRLGDTGTAIRVLTKCIKIKPTYRAFLARAQLYLQQHVCEFAEQDFKKVVDLEPECVEGHLGCAKVMQETFHFAGALKCLDAALRVDPDNHDALLSKGCVLLEMRRPQDAIEVLRCCLEISEDSTARRRRAEAHIRMSNYVEAIADLDLCLEAAAEDAEALLIRGWLYLEMGELDYASEDFKASQAAAAKSESPPHPLTVKYVQLMKARAELQAGRFDRCRERCEKLGGTSEPGKISTWDETPNVTDLLEVPFVFLIRGVVAFCQGEHSTAVRYLQRAATSPAREPYEKAAPCVAPEPSLPPHSEAAEALRCLSRSFVMGNTHQFRKARAALNKAVERMPHSGPVRVLRAVVTVNMCDANRTAGPQTKPATGGDIVQEVEADAASEYEQLLKDADSDLTVAATLGTAESDEAWMYYMRGVVRRELMRYEEALEDFARVADAARQGGDAENPDLVELEAEATYASAHTKMAQGDIAEAVRLLEGVCEALPGHVEALVHLARCKAELGETDSPISLMAQAVKANPEDPTLLVHAGDVAYRLGQLTDALGLYGEAINVTEEAAHEGTLSARGAHLAHRHRAWLHMSKGRFRDAMFDLRKVVNLKPSDREGVFDRDATNALCTAMAGDFKGATVFLGPLVMQCEAEPNLSAIYSLPLLLTIRGACWWYRNYMDKAREDLDKAWELAAGAPGLHLCYAQMILKLQDKETQSALECLELALSILPTGAPLHLLKGEVRSQIAREAKSTIDCSEDFKEAYRLQPVMVDEYLRLNKLCPTLPRSSEPDCATNPFMLGAGNTKSFIQLRPLFPWPDAHHPPALAPECVASLPWERYFKHGMARPEDMMAAFHPVVGQLMPQLTVLGRR